MVNGRWRGGFENLGTLSDELGRELRESLVMTGSPFKRGPVRRCSAATSAYGLARRGKAPKHHGDKIIVIGAPERAELHVKECGEPSATNMQHAMERGFRPFFRL